MSNNIIDKIQLSGVTYDIGGQGGSGVSVIEVSQAEYDALPSSAKTDTSKMYVITDAEAGDLTNYYTKTETNTLLGGKADTATTYTKSEVDTALSGKADTATTYTKTEVDNAITAATATKQDTLVSGTNIKTINNESILGSGNIDIQGGGGKAVTGGTNISVVTGETADTINCTLPIYINSNVNKGDINIGTDNNANYDYYRIAIGRKIDMSSTYGGGSIAIGVPTSNSSITNKCYGDGNIAIGRQFQIGESNSYSGARWGCVVIGDSAKSLINGGVAIGNETTVSGTTKTNINNQLTIDTSNQVYIYNKDNTEMICLQDQLGGGGGISSAECQTMIDNSISGKADSDDVYTTGQTSGATELATAFAATQPKLSAGTGISIDANNVISATGGGGGGKAIEAGTNISITTGETADTINCTLPITVSKNGNQNEITFNNVAKFNVRGNAGGAYAVAIGDQTVSNGSYAIAIGYGGRTNARFSNAFGYYTVTNNDKETAQGVYNNSVTGSSTFGDSGNTLFSVGNGTSSSARHNAFEIRQNGDIYYFDGTNDVKLQDKLSSLDTTIGNINTILESI